MALTEDGQITINNAGSTELAFTYMISSVIMWSADDSFYVNHDAAATTSNFLHPQDSPIAYGVPCHTMGLRAQNQASAVVMYLAIYRMEGVDDSDPDLIRGGIDV